MRRALLAALAAVLLVAAAPERALAAMTIDDVGRALRSQSVVVDPDAETKLDVTALRSAIGRAKTGPFFLAVLSADALRSYGNRPDRALPALRDAVGREGTYALVAGTKFGAGSTTVGGVGDAATAALRGNQGDPQAGLEEFIARVGQLRAGDTSPDSSGSNSGGAIGAVLGLLVVAAIGTFFLVGRKRKRRREAEALAEVKDATRDDLLSLGEDIRALDLDVEMPDVDPDVRHDYERAVTAYDRANTVWRLAERPEDLKPAAEALEEGRWAMASAKARLEGEEPPERRPPCFFDPRHGPSTREVEWTPEGGQPRLVPACEADAVRVEDGDDPQTRTLNVGGRDVPYWNAGPAYAPFYGGFFSGGFIPGMLTGTFLGASLGDGGWGDVNAGDVGGGDWSGGSGDSGGGDWGGGFGGGDFGGGGGGDWGGGGGDFGGGDFGG